MKTIIIIIFLLPSPLWAAGTSLSAYLDVRPSWTGTTGSLHTENEIGAAYALSPTASLGYVQEFRTNLYRGGEAFGLRDGYFKGTWDGAAETALGKLGLEARAILPTDSTERAAGLLGALRPIAKLSWELTGALGLELWESPVLPWYTRDGTDTDEGPTANRAFENRLELVARFTFLADKVSLRLPLIYQAMRLRPYQQAAAWKHALWVNPELLVAVAEGTSIGASYYSASFVGENAGFAGGLESGVAQLVLQQTLF